MIKKRNQKIHECQTAGRRILSGKFALTMKSNYAVGDQDNNLLLYNNLSCKPISMMNSQTSNFSSLTALTFANQDTQIIAGSNRGSINSWDIQTAKISFCLKGHTIEVCSLYTDKKNPHLIVSGSMDTNTKIWDLRTKNAISTLKNHHKKVTALNMTPDSKIVISGSEDGVVQTWQIRMQRVIFQYEIGSSILSLDSNFSNTLVVGTQDRVARLFQINAPFSMIGQTKNETMPITNCAFYKQNYLFTAGTDNLKVWNIESDILMTDNIETSSKGILHMVVDDKVQQIAYCGGSLSYHECLLTQVNFSTQMQSPGLKYEIHQLENSPFSMGKNLSTIKRGSSMSKPVESFISGQKAKDLFSKRNDSIKNTMARDLSGLGSQINDVLANIKKVSNDFESKKKQTAQLEGMMGQQHLKFMKIMAARTKSMQTILESWSKGNFKFLIQHLKTQKFFYDRIDIYVASDALTQILAPSRYQISSQFALAIAERSKQMILSKHMTLVKSGISHLLKIVSLFKDEMIKLKTFGIDKGVDLAREQRLRRFDQLIEQYIEVFQSQRIKKVVEKKDEVGLLAAQLQKQLKEILNKVYGDTPDKI